MTFTSQASDLIFKQGFENSRLVSGQVTGLLSAGLQLQLTAGDDSFLAIQDEGVFTFELDVTVGQMWQVEVLQLPHNPQQQSCQISQNSGVMSANGVDDVLIVCDNTAWHWDEMNWNQGGWNW